MLREELCGQRLAVSSAAFSSLAPPLLRPLVLWTCELLRRFSVQTHLLPNFAVLEHTGLLSWHQLVHLLPRFLSLVLVGAFVSLRWFSFLASVSSTVPFVRVCVFCFVLFFSLFVLL